MFKKKLDLLILLSAEKFRGINEQRWHKELSKASKTWNDSSIKIAERVLRQNNKVPAEYEGMRAVLRWAKEDGEIPRMGPDDPSFFYLIHADLRQVDRDLIEQLLADLAPKDLIRQFVYYPKNYKRMTKKWPEETYAFAREMLNNIELPINNFELAKNTVELPKNTVELPKKSKPFKFFRRDTPSIPN